MKEVTGTIKCVLTRDMLDSDCESFEMYCDAEYLKKKGEEIQKKLGKMGLDCDSDFGYDKEKDEVQLDISILVTMTDSDYEDGDVIYGAERDVEKVIYKSMDIEVEAEFEEYDVVEYTTAEEEMEY